MRSAVHSSQEKKGFWVYSTLLNQKVFIEDVSKNQIEIYENPTFKESGEVPTAEALPRPSPVVTTNVTSVPPAPLEVVLPEVRPVPVTAHPPPLTAQNITSIPVVVDSSSCDCGVAPRSNSITSERSSSVCSGSSTIEQNNLKFP